MKAVYCGRIWVEDEVAGAGWWPEAGRLLHLAGMDWQSERHGDKWEVSLCGDWAGQDLPDDIAARFEGADNA